MTPKQLLELCRECYRADWGARGVGWVKSDCLESYLSLPTKPPMPGPLCAVAMCCFPRCQRSIGIRLRPRQGLEQDGVLDLLPMLREPEFGKWLDRRAEAMSSPTRLLPDEGQLEELERWVVNSHRREFCPEHAETEGAKT